ncbi:MAG TPA: zinc-binding alcohol dehydrogenase family protein [Gaiellaceae bacterium]|nr:zinc-binding alcohol dehydrogenase family protein [Gaiellaceae bacterium]
MRAAHVAQLKEPPRPVEIDDAAEPARDALEIVAVALNPLDLAVGGGAFYGGHPPLPYVPGCEAAARTADGRLVYLFGEGRGVGRDGFLAERVAVPGDLPLELPDGTDPALAAAAGIAGIAAWVPVAWKAKVAPGDRVLVLGGTGSVGRLAAQAAELLGAEIVVAVGSKELDRIPEQFGDDGFTVCIDPVWGEPLANALRYARPHARIVHVGQSAGPESPLRSADVRGRELAIVGHSNFVLTKEERDRAYLELLAHLTAGRIRLDYETFPLDEVAAAWEHQRGGKSVVLM